MSSLGRRLTLGVGLVVALCLAAFSTVVFLGVSHAMWAQFDEGLGTSAEAIASMVENPEPGKWEFEYAGVSDFETAQHPDYFEVWDRGGQVIARSGSLKGGELARDAPAAVASVTLPDGRRGRGVVLMRRARGEQPGSFGDEVRVQVVRGTAEVQSALQRLALFLAVLTALGALLGGLAGAWIVSRGLSPLAALSDRLSKMRAADLGTPLEVSRLPAELSPLVGRLNETLARLGESFDRERRFTADVSHELRTPLAALRLTLEVSASAERDPAAYRAAIGQAIASVTQLQTLVDNLLTLARLDAGQLKPTREDVALRAMAERSWRTFSPVAERRRLRFTNRLGEQARVQSDGAKLQVILDTLLSNAASHTQEGGEVVLDGGTPERWLEVWDSGPEVPRELLPRLFERFVRGDRARSADDHTGIGLSLARAMAQALELEVSAENQRGGVRFWVHPRG